MLGNRAMDFLSVSFQYFVAGRHAYSCRFVPVSANLFHHAFEMIFKARILETRYTPEHLKQKPYGHSLGRLWTEFKSLTGATHLAQHDPAIAGLDTFEEIRYPNFPKGHSIIMVGERDLNLASSTATVSMTRTGPVSSNASVYTVNLEAMDLLFKDVTVAFPLNPEFIKSTILQTPEAMTTYLRDNRHPI